MAECSTVYESSRDQWLNVLQFMSLFVIKGCMLYSLWLYSWSMAECSTVYYSICDQWLNVPLFMTHLWSMAECSTVYDSIPDQWLNVLLFLSLFVIDLSLAECSSVHDFFCYRWPSWPWRSVSPSFLLLPSRLKTGKKISDQLLRKRKATGPSVGAPLFHP